jgi:CubicO group peptidase (beta-lactamase class C family)
MRRRTAAIAWPALALGLGHRSLGAQALPSSAPEGLRSPAGASGAFGQLAKLIEADYPDVQSVVVVRQGHLLFDHHRSTPETLHAVQSVTKSVLSLVVGAAVGRGLLSLDQTLGELLGVGENDDVGPASRRVTVRQLLTMTAGFRTQERFAPETADDVPFLLRRGRAEAPGAVFAYDNLSANLLSVALEAASSQPTSRLAEEAVFRPLGITAYEWARGAHGHSLGFSGLRLRTRDMARLGELALNSGAWAGVQVLPQDYARASVTAQNAGGPPVGLSYGYLWWVVPSALERQTFLASGWGGQFIWVYPPLGLVIATTSTASAESNRRGQALALIRNQLFRAAAAPPG